MAMSPRASAGSGTLSRSNTGLRTSDATPKKGKNLNAILGGDFDKKTIKKGGLSYFGHVLGLR